MNKQQFDVLADILGLSATNKDAVHRVMFDGEDGDAVAADNVTRMRRAMDSADITRLLEDTRGQALDVSANPATPLFLINGALVSGFNQQALEERLREATLEVQERRAQR